MPLYEYCCPECGEKKEVLVRSSEATSGAVCPTCGIPMAKEWCAVATHSKSGGAGCAPPRGGFS